MLFGNILLFASKSAHSSADIEAILAITEYNRFKSVYWRLRGLKMNLINSQSANQLKQHFTLKPDFDIFLAILNSDINIIKKYGFEENSIEKNTEILKTILNYHIRNENAQKTIIDQLKTLNYEDHLYDLTIEKLYYFNQTKTLFELLEFLLENNIEIFNNHLEKIQSLPYSILTSKLKDIFISFKVVPNIPYTDIQKDKLTIVKQYRSYIHDNGIYIINNYKIRIKSISQITKRGQRTILLSYNSDKSLIKLLNEDQIDITLGSNRVVFKYSSYRITKRGDKWEFYLKDYKEHSWLTNLKSDVYKIKIANDENWDLHSWGFEEIVDPNFLNVYFDILEINHGNLEFPLSGLLTLSKSNILIEHPSKYHPDTIVSNTDIISMLHQNIKDSKFVDFVRQLGITYIFHKEIPSVHYGIIDNVFGNSIKLYSITKNVFIEILEYHSDLSKYKTEKIVVIENNNRIKLLNEKDEYIDKIGYVKSDIINVYPDKQEGFIANNKPEDTSNYSDYYFHFRSCNFTPKTNDTVKFIPALNPSKKYLNEPIALKIIKIHNSRCKVLFSDLNHSRTSLYGKAVDIETDETLFFSLPLEYLQYIQNVSDQIVENQIFEYRVIKEKKDELLKLIKFKKLVI
jgi:hypothetical protein